MLDRTGIKEWRHEAELIVVATKAKACIGLKSVPNSAQTLDVFAHATDGISPVFGEAALDMRANLSSKTENEAPVRLSRQVPGDLGGDHRAAREGERDLRPELDALRVRGRERERKEWIVGAFRRPGGIQSQLFSAQYMGCVTVQKSLEGENREIKFHLKCFPSAQAHRIRLGPYCLNQVRHCR